MPDAIGFHCHERAVCIQTMLAQAQEHSAAAGLRLSPVRRRTLEVLLAEHRALGFFWSGASWPISEVPPATRQSLAWRSR